MIAEVNPSHLQGSVAAPPSKSAAHRYLIASFLSGEKCTVDNVVLSEDIKATLSCLESLGANVKIEGRKVTLTKEEPKENILHCRESGSTLRFLIPFANPASVTASEARNSFPIAWPRVSLSSKKYIGTL